MLMLPAMLAVVPLASANTELWVGVAGTSTTTNWSDNNNWIIPGGGTPNGPNGNDTVFGTNGASGTPGIITSVVDQNGLNPFSLTFTNGAGYCHTVLIPANVTMSDANNFTCGFLAPSSAAVFITNAITGGGEFDVNGTVNIGLDRGSGVAILDMSGLSTFKQNFATGQFYMGFTSVNNPTVFLATNSTIIVATLSVQDSNGQNGRTGVLNLGTGTNILQANTINIGLSKANGTIQFPASAPATAGVSISGTAGGTARATILLGNSSSGSGSSVGNLFLAGHPATVLASTLTIGNRGNDTGNANGTVTFDNGTFDVTSILIAGYTANATPKVSTGVLTVGGNPTNKATLNVAVAGVGSFVVGDATFASGDSVGTFNLNTNATALVWTNITKSATAGATNAATINITGATLNMESNLIGSVASPIDHFNITNATLVIPAGVTASVTVSNLSFGGGTNVFTVTSLPLILSYPSTNQLIKYTVENGTPNAGLNTSLLPAGFTGVIFNDTINKAIDVIITGGPAPPRILTWNGMDPNNGNALTSVWDINTTMDWLSNTTAVAYNDNGGSGGDIVTLNDSGATNVVTLAVTVSPSEIMVSNNVLNYTINDNNSGYALAGNGSLAKQGSLTLVLDNSGGVTLSGGITIGAGTLQIGNNDGNGGLGAPAAPVVNNGAIVFSRNNSALIISNVISGAGSIADNDGTGTLTLSGANSFTGAVMVASGGILQAGNNSALGSTNGGTTIASGAALDVFAHNLGQEPVTVSGTGPDSTKGAIYNSGTNILAAIARLTLAGDTTIGGPVNGNNSGRWDLRSANTGDANGASLTVLTPGTKLTKVGANFTAITGVTVDTNLGDIDIKGGALSIETATTGLGNPANTLTVENGATLSIFNATNLFNKNIALNGNGINNNLGTLDNSSGNNTVVGPMQLNGTDVEITFRSSIGAAVGGSLTLSNTITGSAPLTKEDTNTLTLAGPGNADNHTGGIYVGPNGGGIGGVFIMNTINTNMGNALLETAAGGSIDNNGVVTPPLNFVGGNGTNYGEVGIQDIMWPGVGGKFSTFGAGNIDTGGGGVPAGYVWSLGSVTNAGNGFNDLINVQSTFDTSGSPPIYINPLGVLTTNGVYTLVECAPGGIVNGFAAGVHVYGGLTTRYTFSRNQDNVNGVITLQVSGQPGLVEWTGLANDGLWNPAGSQNWTNLLANPAQLPKDNQFYQSDTVLFDDTIIALGTTNVITIPAGVAVLPVAITNNSSTNYNITGPGKISGATGLAKLGASTLAINTTNDFTGNVTISAGVVKIGNSASLGSTNTGAIIIASGATLDFGGAATNNNLNLGAKAITVSGVGTGGLGAIINSSAGLQQQNVLHFVTLAGDTTFGGPGNYLGASSPGRWDIRNLVNSDFLTNTSAYLSTGGQSYNLYKTGSNQVSLVGVQVDSALANVYVQGGLFSIEHATTLGNPASNLVVSAGAAIQLWAFPPGNVLNKVIVLNGDGVTTNFINGSGTNVINGPVTLNGGCIWNIGGSILTNNGVISGTGSLTKGNTSLLVFTVANTYSGNTTVAAGTLQLAGSGSIANSSNLIVQAGATLDVSARIDGKLTVTASQTLSGSGTVTGSISNAPGSALAPGTSAATGRLTVTNNAVLAGNAVFKLNGATNDVLSVGNNLTYGGTLTLTNIGSPLMNGNSFKLFAVGASGTFVPSAFSSIVPAHPNNDTSLNWNTNNLTVNGTISVVSAGPTTPRITSIGLNGAALSLTATNGTPNAAYYLLQTTNVALPLSQWTPVVTNAYDNNGNASLTTNIVSAANANVFYILSNTNNR